MAITDQRKDTQKHMTPKPGLHPHPIPPPAPPPEEREKPEPPPARKKSAGGKPARGAAPTAPTRAGGAGKSRPRAAEPRLLDLMVRELVTVNPEASLREVVEILARLHIGGMPVVANGAVVGVISVADVVSFLASTPGVPREDEDQESWTAWSAGTEPEPREGEESSSRYFLDFWREPGADAVERIREIAGPEWDQLAEHTVGEVMTRALQALPATTPVSEAAAFMLRAGVHRVLVMEQGVLLGMVTTTDIVRAVAERRL